jgi:catechol 2,3-dioxygenase-like lactoylglutathione lyase family enzyme
VRDLQLCRAFYRDILGLGQPVVDSNLWVEFEPLPGRMILALQSCHGDDLPRTRTTAWCFECPDPAALAEQLRREGVQEDPELVLPTGRRALRFQDPEGNPFLLLEQNPANTSGNGASV